MVFAALCSAPAQPARPELPGAERQVPEPRVVVATVNGEAIFAHQVRRELDRALKKRPVETGAIELLQAQTLAQLIDRRLILDYLAQKKAGASRQDVELAIERIEKRLAQQDRKLDDYLEAVGFDEAALRRALAWQLGWQRYLDRHLTDENLQKFFQQHRRDFDGTKIRAAHILLRVEPLGDRKAREAAIRASETIRREIVGGTITFAAAATKHSQAPTADRGGDIGLISRHEPMPEAFSQAAYALKEGECSEPVVSPFGVHLVKCLQIKPGEKTWQQARDELKPAVTRFLFQWIADRQRPGAKIEFTGAMPHFKPGTKELAP